MSGLRVLKIRAIAFVLPATPPHLSRPLISSYRFDFPKSSAQFLRMKSQGMRELGRKFGEGVLKPHGHALWLYGMHG